jgi:hypothetical protein
MTRPVRRSGAILAGGAGLAAGFAAGCAVTLAGRRPTLTFQLGLGSAVQSVEVLVSVATLLGVFGTLAALLVLDARLRRIAHRVELIAASQGPAAHEERDLGLPSSGSAGPPRPASPDRGGAGIARFAGGDARGPQPSTPSGYPATPAPQRPRSPTSTIGGPALEPTGENAVERWESRGGTVKGGEEQTPYPSADRDGGEPAAAESPASGPCGDAALAAVTPLAERLVEVWSDYLDRGDGHFEPRGLQRHLEAAGLQGTVAAENGLGDGVLGVDLGDGRIYLLPHFNSTPRAVAAWFDSRPGASSRLDRVKRLVQVAVARRSRSGNLELCAKGLVE